MCLDFTFNLWNYKDVKNLFVKITAFVLQNCELDLLEPSPGLSVHTWGRGRQTGSVGRHQVGAISVHVATHVRSFHFFIQPIRVFYVIVLMLCDWPFPTPKSSINILVTVIRHQCKLQHWQSKTFSSRSKVTVTHSFKNSLKFDTFVKMTTRVRASAAVPRENRVLQVCHLIRKFCIIVNQFLHDIRSHLIKF